MPTTYTPFDNDKPYNKFEKQSSSLPQLVYGFNVWLNPCAYLEIISSKKSYCGFTRNRNRFYFLHSDHPYLYYLNGGKYFGVTNRMNVDHINIFLGFQKKLTYKHNPLFSQNKDEIYRPHGNYVIVNNVRRMRNIIIQSPFSIKFESKKTVLKLVKKKFPRYLNLVNLFINRNIN